MQWENLEFCNNICYESFLYNNISNCNSCGKNCRLNFGPNVQYIGNRMYYFCNDTCEKTFFDLMKCCRFCRNVVTSMKHFDGFCQSVCRIRFKQLYENCNEATNKPCFKCHLKGSANISLCVDDVTYDFCSFSCFFHLKTMCGLFTGNTFLLVEFQTLLCIF